MTLRITLASNVEGWDIMMNGQLETALAADDRVKVTGFVPGHTQEQRDHATDLNVALHDAEVYDGYDVNERLAFPPDDLEIDILIMHFYGRNVGRQAQVITKAKKCKWVLVLHTISKELEKYLEAPAPSTDVQESEHDLQLKLCEKADLVLAVGPQVAEAYEAALRYLGKQKEVMTLMPDIPREFLTVRAMIKNSHEIFRVLISASAKYFKVKGCDIAAKAFKILKDPSFQLILVVKSSDDTDAVEKAMLKEGIGLNQLTVRNFSGSNDKWCQLLCEVDLLIKPSRVEGFGMSGLRAISANLPVLISGNCGLGIALKKLNSGCKYVVDSQDPEIWAEKIKKIKVKDVQTCQSEAEQLKNEYIEEYKWKDQFNVVIDKFFEMIPRNEGRGRDCADGKLKYGVQETEQGEEDDS
ncbi:uncharacterized protein [Montipora capricornis]|uniref:uncharacterized protein isoform X2 n=1 Tax=Montipora capricornis TaxID=246305 RepID=UPI0035F19BF3